MKSTTLRIGDADVARIGLGTNRLTNTPENIAFIREAVDLGVGMIDTAYTYTGGQSEQTIGEALSPIPESCIVATKGGYAPGTGRPEVLRTQIDESLRRLKTDEIDLYYLHRVHEDTLLQDSVGTIAAYHDAGKIRHVGLSQVGIDQIEQAREIVTITAVQNHYNLSERGWDEVVDHCAGEGIVFVPYFPLKGAAVARWTTSPSITEPRPRRSAWHGSCGGPRRRCRSRAPCRSRT